LNASFFGYGNSGTPDPAIPRGGLHLQSGKPTIQRSQAASFSAESLSAIDRAAFELYQSLFLLWRNASVNALIIQVAN
jgi:hypothetical protein